MSEPICYCGAMTKDECDDNSKKEWDMLMGLLQQKAEVIYFQKKCPSCGHPMSRVLDYHRWWYHCSRCTFETKGGSR